MLAFLLTVMSVNFSFSATPVSGKYIETCAALAKLPLGILADYYDCNDEAGKALIFESLYLATDVVNTVMKISHHSDDVSAFEIGFFVYHSIKFFSRIKEYSELSQNYSSKEKDKLEKENNKNTKNNFYKVLLKTLKYGGLVGDSFFSLCFAGIDGDFKEAKFARFFSSWSGSCLKLISTCADTKKSEFYLKKYLLTALIGTVGSIIFKNFTQQLEHEKKINCLNKRRKELETLLEDIRNLGEDGRNVVDENKGIWDFLYDNLHLNEEEWCEKLRKKREELLEEVRVRKRERQKEEEIKRREEEARRREEEKHREEKAKKERAGYDPFEEFLKRQEEARKKREEEARKRREEEARKRRGGFGYGFRPGPDPFDDDFFRHFFGGDPRFGGRGPAPGFARPVGPTYYDVLGVGRNAGEREINIAYRKRALKVHPDKHGGKGDMFKLVGAAKDILLDKQKRREYDDYLRTGFLPPNYGDVTVSPQLLADLNKAIGR